VNGYFRRKLPWGEQFKRGRMTSCPKKKGCYSQSGEQWGGIYLSLTRKKKKSENSSWAGKNPLNQESKGKFLNELILFVARRNGDEQIAENRRMTGPG